jgi:anthranilate synthase component 1
MSNFDAFIEKTKTANVIPVVESLPADLLTPLAVYLKLSARAENSFLLESVEGGETLARYSFIGADPIFIATGNDELVNVIDAAGSKTIATPMLAFLREHFAKYKVYEDGSLPSFVGGAIGSMDFSCSAWFEPSLKKGTASGSNESSFMFFRSIVAFDHAKQVIQIV